MWQLDRAEMKAGLLDEIHQRQSMAELTDLGSGTAMEKFVWRRARLSGRFIPAPTFLLDNRVHAGRAGYFVYSVFQTAKDNMVLVNRGWVQAMPRRDQLPVLTTPAEPLELRGLLKQAPRTGKLLAEDTDEILPNEVIRLQFLNLDHVNNNYNLKLAPLVLRLEEKTSNSFNIDWPSPASGKEKHLGYAFQWFAMAMALLVIFITLNSKRVEKND